MVDAHSSPFKGFVFAPIIVAVAVGIRHLLDPVLGDGLLFAPVLLAVLATAYYFGFRPALAAVILGTLATSFVLLEPRGSLLVSEPAHLIGLLIYIGIGACVAYFAGSMHDAQAALREANRMLESSVAARTVELDQRNQQLERSEDRLRFALTYGRIGGWELNLADLSAYRTAEHDRIFGYDPPLTEWNYDLFLEHVLPEDRAEVDRRFQAALAAGTAWDFECRIRRADGETRWIWASGQQELDDEKRPFRMAGIVQDITERKRVEVALRERERLLAVVTGSARVGMVVVGEGYRYLFANEAYVDIFDLDTKDLVGRRVHDILPAAWSQIQPRLDRALGGERVSYELTLPGHDNQPPRYYAVNYEPRVGDGGERSVVVVVVDITEAKQVALALAEREQMLQFVTSSACVGLVVLGSDYRYLFANEAYGRIYGLNVSEIVGRKVPDVIPYAWPQIKPHLDRSLGGTPGGFDLALPPLPGTDLPRTLSVAYEPHRREDGTPTSVVVISDVSERKQATEAALRLSERVTLAARAAGFGVWDWNMVENSITWDDQMFSLYGRKRGDFAGAYEAWLAGVHPEDRERCNRESEEARNGLREYESEFRVIWPDGSVRYLKALGNVSRDESGQPIRMLGVNFDITEAHLAASALAESQAKLEAALSSMTDAVFISDTSGQFVHFNDGFVTFHRFRARSECALHLSHYPDIIEVYLENGEPAPLEMWAVPRALRGETVSNAEYRIRRKDTGESWYGSYSFSPIRDPGGAIVGAVVVGRDITERRQAAQEALEREERFRQLTESIREVFWMIDVRSGTLLYVSPAYETVWGRSCDSLYASPGDWLAAIVEDDRPKVLEGFEGHKFGKAYDAEYRIMRPDGTIRWIHDRGFPVRDGAGELYRVAGVAEDITERQVAELASQQQQMRMEGIVNSAMDGIITMGEDHRVVLINSAAERMFGCRASEVIGERVERFMPERFREAHSSHVREFGSTGVAARTMGRFGPINGLRSNGDEFPLEASISQIEVGGHKLFTVTCRDVTERIRADEARKGLEVQLQQSQKMEAFGQLAGGVAHDFNNLLTIINGYSEWLLSSMPADGELRPQIAEILKAGEHAATLTRQLLAFSRQQVIEPRILSLNEVVGGVEKMLRRIIGEDVSLSTVLRPSAGFVRVDPGQIEQVIMNLAVNARDAMPQGGQLTIETGDVTFDTEYTTVHAESQPGHMSLLAISDTGVGMSREIQARIFEPFFTTKGHGRGTGLGLAVVHGIVKQSGGSVAVYSEPGRGTTIKVYFPMVEVEEEQSTADEAPRPGGGGETILLVEDEEGVRQMTAMALTALGYHVETACCGPEAIERIGEFSGRIDLLVTDVVMPEMSGRVLAEYLEERYPELKVLFVSGYTDDAVMRHGVLQSDVAFLQKPFTLSGLAQKVRDVLGSG